MSPVSNVQEFKTLDISRAMRCANAAKLAYSEAETLKETSEQLDLNGCDLALIEKRNHAAVVVDCDRFSIFAFRGTELDDLEVLLTDASIRPVAISFGEVHQGFWEGSQLFVEELHQFHANKRNRTLYLTGHSMGGAMACLAAVILDSALDGVYTFAQPPTGTREFGDQYIARFGSSYHRIINVLDDVPKVPIPFVNASRAIRPMGSAIELYRNGEMRSGPSLWLTIMDRWAAARRPSKRYKFVLHSMDEHLRRLRLAQNAA